MERTLHRGHGLAGFLPQVLASTSAPPTTGAARDQAVREPEALGAKAAR